MIIKKGTLLNVTHERKGKFIGIAEFDFNTEEEFYSIASAQDKGIKGGKGEIKWEQGESVPCRKTLCKVAILKTHSQ